MTCVFVFAFIILTRELWMKCGGLSRVKVVVDQDQDADDKNHFHSPYTCRHT